MKGGNKLELEIEEESSKKKEKDEKENHKEKKIKKQISKSGEALSDWQRRWLEKDIEEKELEDTREEHRVMSRALENPLRRKIMKFIGTNSNKTLEEIRKKFGLHTSEAKIHINFLKQGKIVEKVKEGPESYELTSWGKRYLDNVEVYKDG